MMEIKPNRKHRNVIRIKNLSIYWPQQYVCVCLCSLSNICHSRVMIISFVYASTFSFNWWIKHIIITDSWCIESYSYFTVSCTVLYTLCLWDKRQWGCGFRFNAFNSNAFYMFAAQSIWFEWLVYGSDWSGQISKERGTSVHGPLRLIFKCHRPRSYPNDLRPFTHSFINMKIQSLLKRSSMPSI